MAITRTLMGVALGVSLSTFANGGADQTSATVVAEVSGQKLTRAELEQKQAAKLLDARYQHYLAERDALDRVIEDQLLEMQARREHISVDDLIRREVTSQVKD